MYVCMVDVNVTLKQAITLTEDKCLYVGIQRRDWIPTNIMYSL